MRLYVHTDTHTHNDGESSDWMRSFMWLNRNVLYETTNGDDNCDDNSEWIVCDLGHLNRNEWNESTVVVEKQEANNNNKNRFVVKAF